MKKYLWGLVLTLVFFLSVGEAGLSAGKQLDLAYAKQIDVQCYIVTRKQLGEFFSQKTQDVVQLSTKELEKVPDSADVYFLIRVKNNGELNASGLLHCFVPWCSHPFSVKVMKMPPKMRNHFNFVINFDEASIDPQHVMPKISCEWSELESYE